jgi:uncharacterized protein YcbX
VTVITIASLHIYPLKSCRGIELSEARLTDAGLEHDREWMIVTPDQRFVTQREVPRLALIDAQPCVDGLRLAAPGVDELNLPSNALGGAAPVAIWRDRVSAIDEGEAAARWLTDFAGRPLRLVRFDPASRRPSDPAWTHGTTAYSRFSDGFALLAISQASLDDLNRRLPAPLPMNRFRPNLVLDGLPPYGEDGLQDLVAGSIRLRRVKPCTRCAITTTDQATGRLDGSEPLATLKTYRWDPALRGVAFGQNLIVLSGAGGLLRVGMTLDSTGAE